MNHLLALILIFAAVPAAHAQSQYTGDTGIPLDAPYVPTAMPVVKAMLDMANVGPADIVYDLGSGDGRLVIAAAQHHNAKKAVGIDIDPVRIKESDENAKAAGVADRAVFREEDLFRSNFSDATVVTMYLLPEMITRLRPTLQNLTPGSRIVTHTFTMGDWQADAFKHVGERTVYLWVVPAKVAGTWRFTLGADTYAVDLTQNFQKIAGTLRVSGKDAALSNAVLSGDSFVFEAEGLAFEGRVLGDAITAKVTRAGQTFDVTATR